MSTFTDEIRMIKSSCMKELGSNGSVTLLMGCCGNMSRWAGERNSGVVADVK